jgi:hypothetical protein
MKAARNALTGTGTIAELMHFLWQRRLWWMIPFVTVLLLVAMVVVVGEVTGIAPFIYTLF